MDPLEYVSLPASIVLALGITRILTGIGEAPSSDGNARS